MTTISAKEKWHANSLGFLSRKPDSKLSQRCGRGDRHGKAGRADSDRKEFDDTVHDENEGHGKVVLEKEMKKASPGRRRHPPPPIPPMLIVNGGKGRQEVTTEDTAKETDEAEEYGYFGEY